MKKRAFTLVELMVAVGLMAMMIAFTSVIFRFGIDAHRISSAKAEIMQKVRVITEQLNSDLRGLRKDAPLMIWFERDRVRVAEPNRYDQIMFFANGDFTSYNRYRIGLKQYIDPDPNLSVPYDKDDFHVRGNLARIYYSLASKYRDATFSPPPMEPMEIEASERILARRVHIMSADPRLFEWPDPDQISLTFDAELVGVGYYNDIYEHDSVPLPKYKAADKDDNTTIIETCFNEWALVDKRLPETFHKLMCEAISSFSVQWAYWDRDTPGDDYELRWFPSVDPDGDGSEIDSHFRLMQTKYPGFITQRKFGAVFNVRGDHQMNMWMPPEMLYYSEQGGSDKAFEADFFPAALKFTFTVYDSKKIITGGRTFTHIVYLEN